MKNQLISLSFLFLFSPAANAQIDSLQAEQFVAKAKSFLDGGQIDSANHYHAQAKQFFKEKNLLTPWLKSDWTVSQSWANAQKDPFKAIEMVESSLREKWREPLNHREWEQYVANNNLIGFFRQTKLSDFIGAKVHYEQSLQIFMEKMNEESDRTARYLYHNLANIYSRHGDYERAISLLKRSVEYNRKHPKSQVVRHGDLAIALNSLNRHEEALEIVRQGLALPDILSETKINIYMNEAGTLLELDRKSEAFESLEKIPALIPTMVEEQKSYRNEKVYLKQYYDAKGEVFEALDSLQVAELNFLKAIEIGRQHWGTERRREIAKSYVQLGSLKLKQRQYPAALAHFHHILTCVLDGFNTQDSLQLPDFKLFFNENAILEALEGKARAFLALGHLEKTLECYELIPHVEAKIRAAHAYESSMLRALEESRGRFDAAVAVAWQLYEQSGHAYRYAERAFLLSEQARGILLLQNLARAQNDYQLPPEIRKQENDLNLKITWHEREIADEKAQEAKTKIPRLEQLEQTLFGLKQAKERLKTTLRDSFADYVRLFEDIQFRTLGDVSALLRPNQAFVDYYLSDSAAYVFFIEKSGVFSWRKTDLPARFRDSVIQHFLEYLANGQGAGDDASLAEDKWLKQAASDLYQLLLKPELQAAPPSIEALVVAPDDVLAFLPFEMLLREPSQGTWSELPYLVRRFSISYATSATLLAMQQANTHRHKNLERLPFGGFAPKYVNARDPQTGDLLYNIKGMQEQVKAVWQLLGGGKPFYGDEANELEFYRTAPLCQVLLLAMHGFANEKEPALSRLLFGNPNKGDSLDNVLYTTELQITPLLADLVVLNACYTGFGKLHKGEGVYSISRALTSAGVSATLMSIWQLPGASSPVLVENFFKYLKEEGLPKDVALQKAKIALLENNAALRHPSFWAGFLATGDASAMKF